MNERQSELIKIHEKTIFEIRLYETHSCDIDLKDMFDTWMHKEDFEESARKFFKFFQPHSCDLFMNELKRLVDEDREQRRLELEELQKKYPNPENWEEAK